MPTNKQEDNGKHDEDEEIEVEFEPDHSDEAAERGDEEDVDDDDIVDIDLDDLTAMEGPDA